MGFNLGSDEELDGGLHDINVTPFIDVILVLLIVFMVAAPLATASTPLDLPVSSAKAAPSPEPPVTVSVQHDLTVSVDDAIVDRAALGSALTARSKGNRDARIFLRADKAVAYGDLMAVMDALRDAGYLKVALVTADRSGR